MKKPLKQVKITKLSSEGYQYLSDNVIVEAPLQISLSEEQSEPKIFDLDVAIAMRTPGEDHHLAIGYLLSEGIITHPHQIVKILSSNDKVHVIAKHLDTNNLDRLSRQGVATSACGLCGKTKIEDIYKRPLSSGMTPRVSIETLLSVQNHLSSQDSLFSFTGGNHAAALCDLSGTLILIKEDVGRHNAMDKILGHAFLMKKLPLSNTILLLSGRISYELVLKAIIGDIKIIVAKGAPSSLAIKLAEEHDIILVGFVKKGSCNIYNGFERIIETLTYG